MYRNILIPTDGSTGAHRGVEHGLELAGEHDATVHALHVVDQRIYGETPALSSSELYLEELESRGEVILSELVAAATERDLEVVSTTRRGRPDEVISSYVDEHDVDLVVMGMHGTGGRDRPDIGSVTERVLQHCRAPVIPV